VVVVVLGGGGGGPFMMVVEVVEEIAWLMVIVVGVVPVQAAITTRSKITTHTSLGDTGSTPQSYPSSLP
jgi:hypothetical protein